MTQANASRPSVAIIGAGWAGLACALGLARAGYAPLVFESAPEPGGRARRAKLDNTFRDNGQHLMLAGCKALSALFKDIGLSMPRTPFAFTGERRGLSLVHGRGRIGLLLALYRAPGFSMKERWALMRALLGLQLRGWQVAEDETVAQWLEMRQQPPTLIEHFWTPLALAVLNTPIEIAAMSKLAPVLRDTLGRGAAALDILQPTADLSASVVTALVRTLESQGGQVHCGQRVTAVASTTDGRYVLTLQHSAAAPIFDHLVLAVPPWSLAHIDLPFDTASLTDAFGTQPIATVYFGFEDGVRLPAPLMQITGPTEADARIWAIDRAHCGEPGVIALSLSADGPWTQLDHEGLAKRCLNHLQASLGMPLHAHWHKVVMVRKATPAATPQAKISAAERHPLPGLWLSGDWTHPVYPATLEAAVAAGFAVAEEIIVADS
jgi:squalene-associated FAD-dependent desaturase